MWQHLAAFGSSRKDLDACGSVWQHVATFGSILAEFGRIWLHAAVTVTAGVDGTPAAIILLVATTANATCETT